MFVALAIRWVDFAIRWVHTPDRKANKQANGLNCMLQNTHVEFLVPSSESVTVFGDRAFKAV